MHTVHRMISATSGLMAVVSVIKYDHKVQLFMVLLRIYIPTTYLSADNGGILKTDGYGEICCCNCCEFIQKIMLMLSFAVQLIYQKWQV